MATSENPNMDGIALKAYLDGLISVGDLTVRPGHRLELGKDGLPGIVALNPEPGKAFDANCQQRLTQIIQILESPKGPQSAAWRDACVELRRLKDHASNVSDINIKAWYAVLDAYNSTKKDVDYLKSISKSWMNVPPSRASFYDQHMFFPQRVCRLFGVDMSGPFSPTSWEDSLEEKMLQKDEEIHGLVNAAWLSIKDGQWDDCNGVDVFAVKEPVDRILQLDQLKAIEHVLDKGPFVMLKIKARSSRKLQPNGREIEESSSLRAANRMKKSLPFYD